MSGAVHDGSAPAEGTAAVTTPVITVLADDERPPGMREVEASARVRYIHTADLGAALADTDVLFVWDFQSRALPGAWPADAPVRWLHAASAGVDPLLFPALIDSDTVVTNSRGVFDLPIAEYVLGLCLAAAKDLPLTRRLQAERTWRHRESERFAGTTALVVGAGAIGAETARLLDAAGVQATLVGSHARGEIRGSDELAELLPDADWVIVVLPLTTHTEGMFDATLFARMRRTARFVNVGRGRTVVEADLVAALRDGVIAGAALDVFADEPLPADSPLWGMDNVTVSPHMAGDVTGWESDLVDVFIDNLARFWAGTPLRNVVDKRLGYVPRGDR